MPRDDKSPTVLLTLWYAVCTAMGFGLAAVFLLNDQPGMSPLWETLLGVLGIISGFTGTFEVFYRKVPDILTAVGRVWLIILMTAVGLQLVFVPNPNMSDVAEISLGIVALMISALVIWGWHYEVSERRKDRQYLSGWIRPGGTQP